MNTQSVGMLAGSYMSATVRDFGAPLLDGRSDVSPAAASGSFSASDPQSNEELDTEASASESTYEEKSTPDPNPVSPLRSVLYDRELRLPAAPPNDEEDSPLAIPDRAEALTWVPPRLVENIEARVTESFSAAVGASPPANGWVMLGATDIPWLILDTLPETVVANWSMLETSISYRGL
jgi:hypothetical protein